MTNDLFDRRSAIFALVLFILHPQVNNFVFRCATETVFILIITMLVHHLVRYVRSGRPGDLAWAAVWVALSLLTRQTLAPFAILCVPVLMVWRCGHHDVRKRLRSVAVAVAIVLLILAPWVARNYVQSGHVPVLQTWVGAPLYQGTYVSGNMEEFLARKKSIADLDQQALTEINGRVRELLDHKTTDQRPVACEVAADRYARAMAYSRILKHPGGSSVQLLRNLFLAPVLQMTWRSTYILMLWNWPLLFLCALGVVWCMVAQRQVFIEALPMTVIFLYFLCVHSLIWPQARYILPVLVPFSGFAAFFASRLCDKCCPKPAQSICAARDVALQCCVAGMRHNRENATTLGA
jgi:hypothetical protein